MDNYPVQKCSQAFNVCIRGSYADNSKAYCLFKQPQAHNWIVCFYLVLEVLVRDLHVHELQSKKRRNTKMGEEGKLWWFFQYIFRHQQQCPASSNSFTPP